jgi:hypothetical protein
MVKEVDCNKYEANMNTHILADDKGEAMVYHG